VAVGKALKGWRDRVWLATKNPIEDNSGDHWRERLESSLKNLDVDHIDFYHLWGISWDAFSNNIEKNLLGEIDKIKGEGLIRNISFSFHDKAENMKKIIDAYDFASVLCQYNLLDRSNEEAIHYAHEKGLGVVIMGPVGGGRLGYPSQAIQSLLPGGVSSSPEIALRFVLAHPGVSCALSGMSDMAQVEQNAQILSNTQPLSEAEVAQVEAAMAENKKRAELYCTGCNYCMPCPNEVGIPQIFEIMNYHRVYGLTEHAKNRYAGIGKNDMKFKNASACIDCGLCEEKCPQKIKIREQLKETARVLA
jgi:predicted aldo/keto reductase-like oxidoreductase